jgi:uncharacterized protein YdaU (DUF1376 family)
MPIEWLVDDPDVLALPVAGMGILMRLVGYFWATNCRPLPVADHELRGIARAHYATWKQWRDEILKIIERARPELEGYYEARKNKIYACSITQNKAAQAAKKAARANAQNKIDNSITSALPKRTQENRAVEIAQRHAEGSGFSEVSA